MSEFEQFNQISRSRYGQMIYNKNDAYIGRSIEKYGEYSELETVIFDQFVPAKSVPRDWCSLSNRSGLSIKRSVGI